MAIEFAIQHEGMDDGQAAWVLAVEGERLLLAAKDGTLYWREMADCKLIKAATPDNPKLVIPVQAQAAGPQIVTPGIMPNRAMRRNGNS